MLSTSTHVPNKNKIGEDHEKEDGEEHKEDEEMMERKMRNKNKRKNVKYFVSQ